MAVLNERQAGRRCPNGVHWLRGPIARRDDGATRRLVELERSIKGSAATAREPMVGARSLVSWEPREDALHCLVSREVRVVDHEVWPARD